MASALWGKFASDVLKEVKFKYDHTGIRRELLDHMEELYEDLQAEGMDADVAEIMAAEYMGDAKEIGQALNKEHNPLLGQLWLIAKAFAWAFLICVAIPACVDVAEVYHGLTSQYIEKTDSLLVYTVPLEEEWDVRGERIRLREARYYADGTLELRGDSLDWDRERGTISGLCRHMSFTDNAGNLYTAFGPEEGSISQGAGLFFPIQMQFADVPAELEEIEFCYDWFGDGRETISLTEGREVAE